MHIRRWILGFALLAGMASRAEASGGASGSRTLEEWRNALTVHWVIWAYNNNYPEGFAAGFAEHSLTTFPGSPAPLPKAAATAFYESFKGPFPDIQIEQAAPLVIEGKRVTLPYYVAGTHTGPLVLPGGTLPPTGAVVRVRANAIFELENGKIVRLKDEVDQAAFFSQLGFGLPPSYGYPRVEAPFADVSAGRTAAEQARLNLVKAAIQALNDKDIEAYEARLGADFQLESAFAEAPLSRAEAANLYDALAAGFPDFAITLDGVAVENDEVSVIYHLTGTHTGTWVSPSGTFLPTGNAFNVTGTAIFEVRGGKIRHTRDAFDFGNVLGPLGLL